jgi:predicted transcriptional regulator
MNKAYVVCTHCQGTGSIELTGVYADTLGLVIRHPHLNGAELAEKAGCEATAMNNRLKAMERHGVVTGTKYGREIRWKQKKV